jgi:hypothetical protein
MEQMTSRVFSYSDVRSFRSSGRVVDKQEVTQFWDYFRLVGDIGSRNLVGYFNDFSTLGTGSETPTKGSMDGDSLGSPELPTDVSTNTSAGML